MTTTMTLPAARMPVLDAVKAMASMTIVVHHLAAYGPMADAVEAIAPRFIDLAFEYGRMAVQLFLAMGGFLMARSLSGARSDHAIQPLVEIGRRYRRLAIPFLAAMALAIACAALARHLLSHDTFPGAPTLSQLLAHALLIQDLAGQPSLSAGAWYVAIDLQLFALSVLLLWVSGPIGRALPWLPSPRAWLFGLLMVASLFFFNRDASWDPTALYFFGAYGFGAFAWWASAHSRPWLALAALAGLGVAALAVDFRLRIALALATALILGAARVSGLLERQQAPAITTYLGKISYSVFLVHFPLCMVVNAVFSVAFPGQAVANLLGMLLAFAASLAAGAWFYETVERRAQSGHPGTSLRWTLGYAAVGLLAAVAAG